MPIDTGLMQQGAQMVHQGVRMGDYLENMKGINDIATSQMQQQRMRQQMDMAGREEQQQQTAQTAAAQKQAQLQSIFAKHTDPATGKVNRDPLLGELYGVDAEAAYGAAKRFSEQDKAESDARAAEDDHDNHLMEFGTKRLDYAKNQNDLVTHSYDLTAAALDSVAKEKDPTRRANKLKLVLADAAQYVDYDGKGGVKTGLNLPQIDPSNVGDIEAARDLARAKALGIKGQFDQEYKTTMAQIAEDQALTSRLNALKPPAAKNFTQEQQLRTQFDGLTKDYRSVKDAYNRVQSSASNPSAAGDLSLIFNYMKMLDPGSTVREGEFATAQNATGVPQRVLNSYNKTMKGERLSESQRKDFLGQTKNLFAAQEKTFKQVKNKYTNIAKEYDLNPTNIVEGFDLDSATESAAPTATTDFDSLWQELGGK